MIYNYISEIQKNPCGRMQISCYEQKDGKCWTNAECFELMCYLDAMSLKDML